MNIKSNYDLYIALNNTRDSQQRVESFVKWFKEENGGLHLPHKKGSFFRCASMYMDRRWEYDHKYFQRMIKRDRRMNAEVVGCIITKMSELNKNDLSSIDDSMSSL